jgi:lysophospholipase L1-like esterase
MKPSDGLAISCPVGPTVVATDGVRTTVSFTAPAVSGGAAPVTTTCTPASGSSFAVGNSTVTCTARDAKQKSASCAFQVTVTAPPRLTSTNLLAFGDSITEGVLRPSCPFTIEGAAPGFSSLLSADLASLAAAVNVPTSYPGVLQNLLTSRYTAQSVAVTNEGLAGERIEDGALRLPAVLSAYSPQALLLQEGINNINSNDPASIPVVVNGLRTMIRQARGRGMTVFLGTLLPERVGACRGYAPALIAPANDQIRAMALSENAIVVDLFAAFGGVAGELIGPDGLHPNEAGYQKMAETFFGEIKNRLEVKP